jgi:glucose-1-phosphate thymidylyltransferase
MLCVIPIAGRGRRLQSISGDIPKALLNVNNRPLIIRLLERLVPIVTKVCLVVNVDSKGFQESIGDSILGIPVYYSLQPRPLGVADAVLRASSMITESFLVIMGDSYFDETLLPYIEMWKKTDCSGAVMIEPVGKSISGNVGLVKVKNSRIIAIKKGPCRYEDHYRVCGMMILPKEIVEACRNILPADTGEYEIEDAVSWLVERGHNFIAIPFKGWRRNINTPQDLKEVEHRIKGEIAV